MRNFWTQLYETSVVDQYPSLAADRAGMRTKGETQAMQRQRRMREPTPNVILRKIREKLGLTQFEMAATCDVSLRTYQMWEAGQILAPRESTLRGLYRLTGKNSPEELGFQRAQLASVRSPVTDRLVPTAMAVLRGQAPSVLSAFIPADRPDRIGLYELDQIRRRTALLAGMYDQWGGESVDTGTLISSMSYATGLLGARHPSTKYRAAISDDVANMSLAVSAMLADQARYDVAQTTLLVGLMATREAGAARGVLRTKILAQMIRQGLDRRDLPTVLGLLDLADGVAETHHVPTDHVALLVALRAGATGPLGRLDDTLVLAERAQELHASTAKPTIPIADVSYEAAFGLACLELCVGLDVDNATTFLDQAIEAYEPSRVRQQALARTFRVLTLTERGDQIPALRASAELNPLIAALRSTQIRESLALVHLLPRVVRLDSEATTVSRTLHAYPAQLPRDFLRTRPAPTEVAAALQHAG